MSTEPCVCGHDYLDHNEDTCACDFCGCKCFLSLDAVAEDDEA